MWGGGVPVAPVAVGCPPHPQAHLNVLTAAPCVEEDRAASPPFPPTQAKEERCFSSWVSGLVRPWWTPSWEGGFVLSMPHPPTGLRVVWPRVPGGIPNPAVGFFCGRLALLGCLPFPRPTPPRHAHPSSHVLTPLSLSLSSPFPLPGAPPQHQPEQADRDKRPRATPPPSVLRVLDVCHGSRRDDSTVVAETRMVRTLRAGVCVCVCMGCRVAAWPGGGRGHPGVCSSACLPIHVRTFTPPPHPLTHPSAPPPLFPPNHRKKTLLAIFVAVAAIGLIAGLIVGLKPDKKEVTTPSEVRQRSPQARELPNMLMSFSPSSFFHLHTSPPMASPRRAAAWTSSPKTRGYVDR